MPPIDDAPGRRQSGLGRKDLIRGGIGWRRRDGSRRPRSNQVSAVEFVPTALTVGHREISQVTLLFWSALGGRPSLAIEPRLSRDSRGKRPPDTEPNDVVPAVPEAEGRAEEARIEVPGTAANDPVTPPAGCLSRAIRERGPDGCPSAALAELLNTIIP
jgi:hypothetical protein